MAIDKRRFNRYLEALLAGDRMRCADVVSRFLDEQVPVTDIYQRLFQPALYHVGELWEQNRISVASEHIATAITEGLMNELFPRLISTERKNLKAVIASVESELHQVGGKMVADMFEMNGWDAHYLGANTPKGELVRLIEDVRPHVAGLSLSVYFHMNMLVETLDALYDRFPKLPVIVGGQGFRVGGADIVQKHPNAALIDSLDALENYIISYRRQ